MSNTAALDRIKVESGPIFAGCVPGARGIDARDTGY